MKLYMEITKDKYELPLAVAESIKELSSICGVSENTICSHMSKYKHGLYKFSRFVKVDVE